MTSWLSSIQALCTSLALAGCIDSSSYVSPNIGNIDGSWYRDLGNSRNNPSSEDGGSLRESTSPPLDWSPLPLDMLLADGADAAIPRDSYRPPADEMGTPADARADVTFPKLDLACELPTIPRELDWSRGHAALFSSSAMPVYEITVDDGEWESYCAQVIEEAATDTPGTSFRRPYARARVTISGHEIPVDVGIRFRGRSSYMLGVGTLEECAANDFPRKPNFKISVNEFSPGSRFMDMKKLNLIGGNAGPILGAEEILYAHLASLLTVPHPRTNHAAVCFNGTYLGVYTHQEEVDDQPFLEHHFMDASGPYYKCNGECTMTYPGFRVDSFRNKYEPVAGTADTMEELLEFLRLVNSSATEFRENVEQRVDVENWLSNVALELMSMDWDGAYTRGNNVTMYGSPDWSTGSLAYRWSIVRFDTDGAFDRDPDDWDSAAQGIRPLCYSSTGGDLNNLDGTVFGGLDEEGFTSSSARYLVLPARLMWDTHRVEYREIAREVASLLSREYTAFFDDLDSQLELWIGPEEGLPGQRDPYYEGGHDMYVFRDGRLREKIASLLTSWDMDVERADFLEQSCRE